MSVERIAAAHQRRRKAVAKRAADEILKMWRRVDPTDIAASWLSSIPAALTVMESAQAIAAGSAGIYLDDLSQAYSVSDDAAGRVRIAGFAGVASDGRDLETLLYQPAIDALSEIKRSGDVLRGMAAGSYSADMIVRTQAADAGRAADATALVARASMAGYVRVLSPPSCSRCVILAGRFYAWNAGFKRHPRCDCTHAPSPNRRTGDDLTTKPKAYFDSLSEAEQNRVFTNAGAEAIRLGADPAQVVNARRGAAGLTPAGARITADEARLLRDGRDVGHLQARDVFGQQLFVTTEGTTTRGFAGVRLGAKESGVKKGRARYRSARSPRLMPESILQIAGNDRQEAVRLLKRFGYLI